MLFNAKLYNTGLYNGGQSLIVTEPDTLIAFEGIDLNDGVNIICGDLPDTGPLREIIGGDVARGHGQYLTADYYRRKEIPFQGMIQAESADALQALIDFYQKGLRKAEGRLDIKKGGMLRRQKATLLNPDTLFAARTGRHITFCPINAVFETREPFARDPEYTAESETISTSPNNYAMQNIGTAPADPVFILIFDSASSVTAVNIQRIDGNGNTLQEIEFADTIDAGDVLEFDSERKKVFLNGVQQRFTGSFLELQPGSNLIRITITGTSFSITATLKHKNAYL